MPTLETQRSELRKKRFSRTDGPPWHMRTVLHVQSYATYLLIRTGISSRVITFAWFLVSLAGYGVLALGTPWCFAVGSAVLYLKVVLDITDGEIGRYQKRFMSVEEDIATHMKGIYLDRIQHAVESPLWGLALGWGVFRLTGNPWMVAFGVSVAAFRIFARFDSVLQDHVIARFRDRLSAINGNEQGNGRPASAAAARPVWLQVHGRVMLWLCNGKRFNHLVFVLGCSDWVTYTIWGVTPAVPALLCLAGVLLPGAMIARIVHIQCGNALLDRAREASMVAGPSEGKTERRFQEEQ